MITLDNNHWIIDDYIQRMLAKHWQEILIENRDTIIYKGRVRQLSAKNLGFGVVEIGKVPLTERRQEE